MHLLPTISCQLSTKKKKCLVLAATLASGSLLETSTSLTLPPAVGQNIPGHLVTLATPVTLPQKHHDLAHAHDPSQPTPVNVYPSMSVVDHRLRPDHHQATGTPTQAGKTRSGTTRKPSGPASQPSQLSLHFFPPPSVQKRPSTLLTPQVVPHARARRARGKSRRVRARAR